jgi:hypothetical protein
LPVHFDVRLVNVPALPDPTASATALNRAGFAGGSEP